MLNITTLGQSYLILISIIVLSVVFASSLILIKKPKEILSKIKSFVSDNNDFTQEDIWAQLHKSVAYFCSIGLYFLV